MIIPLIKGVLSSQAARGRLRKRTSHVAKKGGFDERAVERKKPLFRLF